MMVDREKFKVYERSEFMGDFHRRTQLEAEQKEEETITRTDGDMDMHNPLERMGRPIQVSTFISILLRLNPQLVFQLSKGDRSKYGIYIQVHTLDLRTNLPVSAGLRHVCGMESGLNLGGSIGSGLMPEFSYLELEETTRFRPADPTKGEVDGPDGDTPKVNKLKKEIRGWRTVLAALLIEGLLTEAQIEKTFKISEGQGSKNWKKRIGKNSAIKVK